MLHTLILLLLIVRRSYYWLVNPPMNANEPCPASSVPTYDIAITPTNEETITEESASLSLYAPSQINSHSFIFRLPTEILESTFIDCARDYYNEDSGPRTPTVPPWVNVSYICRHWRNVALNCPALWSYLFVTSERWTKELLTRSKEAPLKLHEHPGLPYPFSLAFCFQEPVTNHVERIQELHLHIPEDWNVAGYFSLLSSPAPRLQNLRITMEKRSSEWSSILFNGDTPALRTLELSRCPVPWYSFKLNSLTILSLHRVPVQFQQNTEDFLATLGGMQDLKHLYLDSTLGSATGFLSSAAFRTFRKITLPRLSRLWIASPLSTIIALLSCVNIPLKAEVRLECYSERGTPRDDFAPLTSLLAQRLGTFKDHTAFSPTIRSLDIEISCVSTILVFGATERNFNSTVSVSGMNWDCNVPLQIFIPFNYGDRSITPNKRENNICDICCSLPLTSVQSLHVVPPQFSLGFWRTILGHLRDLRRLKLSQGDMPLADLVSILSPTPRSHTDSDNQDVHANYGLDSMLAPALEELELYRIQFGLEPPSECDGDTRATNVQSLFNALSSRKESRGQLTMAQCVAKDDDHKVALDMVGKWEGGHFYVVEEHSRRWMTPK